MDKKQKADYNRRWYNERREAGKCTRCGAKDARTEGGASTCEACRQRQNERQQRYLSRAGVGEKKRAYTRLYYARRREARLCIMCGHQLEADEPHATCRECRLKRSAYDAARAKRIKLEVIRNG